MYIQLKFIIQTLICVYFRVLKVGRTTKTNEADYALEMVTDLVQVVPAIWYTKEEEDQKITRTRSEMDFLATTAVGA